VGFDEADHRVDSFGAQLMRLFQHLVGFPYTRGGADVYLQPPFERMRDQITPHLLISEIRTIAADELWMSMAYKRDSVAIHFTWKQDWPAVSKVLPVIERELEPFQPRPHWGKLFTMAPAVLKSRYERLPEFVEMAKKQDPARKFRNAFLEKNVF